MKKETQILKKGEMLHNALLIAVDAHSNQYDKNGAPYILHPLKVMHYLKTEVEELQCIAILHDAVEDNKEVTYQYLQEMGMSNRVIDGVRCLTKVPGQTAEEYKQAVLSNFDSIRVKMCDLRHNSDIRRMKNLELTKKDEERIMKYQRFYVDCMKSIRKFEKKKKKE